MSPDDEATFAAAMLIAPGLKAVPRMELASASRAFKISASCRAFFEKEGVSDLEGGDEKMQHVNSPVYGYFVGDFVKCCTVPARGSTLTRSSAERQRELSSTTCILA